MPIVHGCRSTYPGRSMRRIPNWQVFRLAPSSPVWHQYRVQLIVEDLYPHIREEDGRGHGQLVFQTWTLFRHLRTFLAIMGFIIDAVNMFRVENMSSTPHNRIRGRFWTQKRHSIPTASSTLRYKTLNGLLLLSIWWPSSNQCSWYSIKRDWRSSAWLIGLAPDRMIRRFTSKLYWASPSST